MSRLRASAAILVSSFGLLAAALAGCGSQSSAQGTPADSGRAQLAAYLRQVEPLRLAVNSLLEGADPILSGYHSGNLSAGEAALAMGRLERRFAAYTVDIAAVSPPSAQLRSLHSVYAHTYILEDSYLAALTLGLGERDLEALPNTQSAQRAAIIQWRTGLEVLARRARFKLPADIQLAGRGEIAPSPGGS